MLSKINEFISKNKPPLGFTAAVGANKESRPMKFPYTFTAKLVQFPWKFHYNTSWMYRYYVYGFFACIPVFMYISTLSNSPENKAKWAEIKRKDALEHSH